MSVKFATICQRNATPNIPSLPPLRSVNDREVKVQKVHTVTKSTPSLPFELEVRLWAEKRISTTNVASR